MSALLALLAPTTNLPVAGAGSKRQQPLHRRAAIALSKVFGVLNGYEAMELPSKDKDGNVKNEGPPPEKLFINKTVARAVVPLLSSDREYEQLRGLRGYAELCDAARALR